MKKRAPRRSRPGPTPRPSGPRAPGSRTSGSARGKNGAAAKKGGAPPRGRRRDDPETPRVRPSREAVRSFLERARIRLSDHQLDQLWRFHEMLRARNAADDLTRLVGFESIVVKHYVDSMIVGDLFPLPPRLLDLGTGGGFPGLPLKIRYPELSLVLVEARERRTAFLADVVRELGLQDVEVVKLKANSRNLAIPVDAVITRAVERISATILRTSNCLGPGGLLLFPKGPSVEPEIEEALAQHGRAIELLLDRPYSLPGTPYQRRLVVIRRRDDRPPGSERA